jgi:hypothetical protein
VASSIFPENIINNPIANPAKKRTRSTAYEVQKRSQRLYSRQLEGKTTRQLVIEHSNIEQVYLIKQLKKVNYKQQHKS